MNCKIIIFSIVLLIVLPSCVGTHIRDEILVPAIQMSWLNVKDDIERGLDDALSKEEIISTDSVFTILELMDDAINSGIRENIMAVPFNVLEPYAYQGIQAKIDAGELTPQTAVFLEERIKNFKYALSTLLKETVYLPIPKDRQYWVQTENGSHYFGSKAPAVICPSYSMDSEYLKYRYGEYYGRYYNEN